MLFNAAAGYVLTIALALAFMGFAELYRRHHSKVRIDASLIEWRKVVRDLNRVRDQIEMFNHPRP